MSISETSRKSVNLTVPLAETALKETKKNGLFILPGIGRLVKSKRKTRMGRNPATGAAIKIPAKTAVKYRVAKDSIAPSKAKKN